MLSNLLVVYDVLLTLLGEFEIFECEFAGWARSRADGYGEPARRSRIGCR